MELAFGNPSYLWLLFSLPLLVISHFIILRFIKRKAMMFANFEAMSRVAGVTLITKNISLLIIRLSILLFLILAAAETTFWYTGQTNKNDFILAIDASASMSAQDYEPNRLEAAKDAAEEFVNSLEGKAEIGVVSFAGTALIEQLPTSNLIKVKQKINEIQIMAAGGTDLSSAIITSTNLLLNSRKGKKIILITDGSNTAGSFIENIIQRGAYYARNYHVSIYTIGIGTNETAAGFVPEELGVLSFFDGPTLEYLANETGGKFYKATSMEDIREAYSKINEEAEEGFVSVELSFTFLLLALILVFIEWGLINTRFRALP